MVILSNSPRAADKAVLWLQMVETCLMSQTNSIGSLLHSV